jgi:uncharacterized protein (DUF1697 family)
MIYIALLRGINVGGNNKIDMKKLEESFLNNNLKNVITYINSGNIIFTSELEEKEVEKLIEEFILKDFELNIKVYIISEPKFYEIYNSIPDTWLNDDIQKTDIMYLWDEIDKPEIVENLFVNESIESLRYVSGGLLYNIKRENLHLSKLNKLAGTRTYKYMTIRNVNTVRRLALLIKELKLNLSN